MDDTSNATINLGDFLINQTKVLTFPKQGDDAKKKSNLNKLEKAYPKITIVVPEQIRSVNPSFLQAFLVDVVKKLGKNGFNKKFTFESKGNYKIDDDVYEAVDRILREAEVE